MGWSAANLFSALGIKKLDAADNANLSRPGGSPPGTKALPMIRWPRGRWNGRRIGGFEFHLAVNLFVRIWCMPSLYNSYCLGLGVLRIWIEPAYERQSPLR
jgi:hypothetical protein